MAMIQTTLQRSLADTRSSSKVVRIPSRSFSNSPKAAAVEEMAATSSISEAEAADTAGEVINSRFVAVRYETYGFRRRMKIGCTNSSFSDLHFYHVYTTAL